jgi:hypothetical protein
VPVATVGTVISYLLLYRCTPGRGEGRMDWLATPNVYRAALSLSTSHPCVPAV